MTTLEFAQGPVVWMEELLFLGGQNDGHRMHVPLTGKLQPVVLMALRNRLPVTVSACGSYPPEGFMRDTETYILHNLCGWYVYVHESVPREVIMCELIRGYKRSGEKAPTIDHDAQDGCANCVERENCPEIGDASCSGFPQEKLK